MYRSLLVVVIFIIECGGVDEVLKTCSNLFQTCIFSGLFCYVSSPDYTPIKCGGLVGENNMLNDTCIP
jgi:hypothetical protein